MAVCAVLTLLWLLRALIAGGPLAGMLFFAVMLSPTLCCIDYGHMQFSLQGFDRVLELDPASAEARVDRARYRLQEQQGQTTGRQGK